MPSLMAVWACFSQQLLGEVGPRRCAGGIAAGLFCFALAASLLLPGSLRAQDAPAVDPAAAERGRELFFRKWTAGDKLSAGGDGLGPMHNAASCADCHHQGGEGGSGEKEKNVDLLTIVRPPDKDPADQVKFMQSIRQVHASFIVTTGGEPQGTQGNVRFFSPTASSVAPTITLHKFSTNPAYDAWRADLVARVQAPGAKWPDGVGLKLSQRRTPALWGARLIDSIPREVLGRAAAIQRNSPNGVRGQVALADRPNVGKFGWRGQTGSLRQFVVGACANELGLRVEGIDQAPDPLAPAARPGAAPAGPYDLTKEQCDDLAAYVASLPAPRAQKPSSLRQALTFAVGRKLFSTTGCSECHRPLLGFVEGIYSDLLLHDMGPELADPASPASLQGIRSSPSVYYGGPSNLFEAVPPSAYALWRTPPLWGVARTAPYLHDGRAATLVDAILAHGGEAADSRSKYIALNPVQKDNLMEFLHSLGVKDDSPARGVLSAH